MTIHLRCRAIRANRQSVLESMIPISHLLTYKCVAVFVPSKSTLFYFPSMSYNKGMKKFFQKAYVLSALVALAAASHGCSRQKVSPRAGIPPLPPETGVKMFAYVSEFVDISPRDSGTVNAAKSSRWIAKQIQRMGYEPKADTWTENTAFGKKTFCNIYVDIPGKSNRVILLGSHYDTKVGISDDFQSANDGGSTTGVLLGLIDHFSATKPQLYHTIRFAFFDGEEAVGSSYRDDDGLHGSKRMAAQFVRNRTSSPLVTAFIIDMVGDFDQKLEIPRNVTPWLATIAVKESAANPENARVSLGSNIVIDDHLPFIINCFPSLILIDFEYGSAPGKHDYWHTAEDTIDKIDPNSLQKVGNIVVGIINRIERGEDVPPELRPPPQHNASQAK